MEATHEQTIELDLINDTYNHEANQTIVLEDVLHVPEMTTNIISIPKLTTSGFRVEFYGSSCHVTRNHKPMYSAVLRGGHFALETSSGNARAAESLGHKDGCAKADMEDKKGDTGDIPKDIVEPEDWKEILTLDSAHREVWTSAMKEEMKTLDQADVWEMVPIPLNAKLLPCRWTFKVKVNEINKPVSAKARLVAKGCSQRPGYDYEDTYAPVVRVPTIRLLLTIAGHKGWKTKHCDVKGAFLYGELSETLYLRLPDGPWNLNKRENCYRLKRAIYGLKQAARAWNLRIHNTLMEFNLMRSDGDRCLYYKYVDGKLIFVIIHVDDILLFSNDDSLMADAVTHIGREYTLKDLGEVSVYLGMYISKDRNSGSYKLHQRPKILKLVEDLNLQQSYGKETPMGEDFVRNKPTDIENLLDNNEKYQRVIGSLLYLSSVSRPDISICTNILGRATNKPSQAHWQGIKRVVLYLKMTIDLELHLHAGNDLQLNAYCDADWGGRPL